MFSTRLNRYPVVSMLLIPLGIMLIVALAFAVKQITWGIDTCLGGLAVWLPNVLFMLITSRCKVKPATGIADNAAADNQALDDSGQDAEDRAGHTGVSSMSWWLAISEAVKIVVSFALLLIALAGLQVAVIPLIAGWLSVLIGQIVASVIVNTQTVISHSKQ